MAEPTAPPLPQSEDDLLHRLRLGFGLYLVLAFSGLLFSPRGVLNAEGRFLARYVLGPVLIAATGVFFRQLPVYRSRLPLAGRFLAPAACAAVVTLLALGLVQPVNAALGWATGTSRSVVVTGTVEELLRTRAAGPLVRLRTHGGTEVVLLLPHGSMPDVGTRYSRTMMRGGLGLLYDPPR